MSFSHLLEGLQDDPRNLTIAALAAGAVACYMLMRHYAGKIDPLAKELA